MNFTVNLWNQRPTLGNFINQESQRFDQFGFWKNGGVHYKCVRWRNGFLEWSVDKDYVILTRNNLITRIIWREKEVDIMF